ncbi:hypothetical protein AMIS_56570 [Actinoplanes missouriensis 431]|uniref:UPF0311 protein AMIS_56570 n=1 Tax=Actinoplanes missouriensis (strain ATCC 14538 / DSM 43046 / CBS 188.64 / JCM 3121 / NBRC 102363 / NCIMB 12654 / NRRL B-3342 / UNCC 431) TaxID=512565 RepID=I0HCZ0_ACTM4|nr:DUF3237 domain-containing protein [Actinoplanes missouriensis]BAL90877.1 hypothetical protein AMIS_56570 [Actinoplanes missouriensis 431]
MLELPDPRLALAFEARVDVAASLDIGDGLQFTPITGGTVSGPRLSGRVLAGGGDWSTTRGQVTALDAHYLLEADDGAVIDIRNRGFWRASPEVEARVEAGEDLPETHYYYRTSPVFSTSAPDHAWLASTVFVGLARGERGQVCIRFFEVL